MPRRAGSCLSCQTLGVAMPYCPNCSADLSTDDVSACWNCAATFSDQSSWKPVSQPSGEFRPFVHRPPSDNPLIRDSEIQSPRQVAAPAPSSSSALLLFWLVAFLSSPFLAAVIASVYASTVSGGGFEGKSGYAWLFALPPSYTASWLLPIGLYALARGSATYISMATVVLALMAAPGLVLLMSTL
jgi:hypothetical protein